jgi:hypothetical protein
MGERARSGLGLGRGPERPRCGGVDKAWSEAGGGDSDAHDQGRCGEQSRDAVRK